MLFQPKPPRLSERVIAGSIDAAVIVVLMAFSFVVPLVTRGFALPMWGVLMVMVGAAVAPLALTGQTLGMKLIGLELVTKTGHRVDAVNVAFRELIGRGYFPAAFLFTMVAGLVARFFHVGNTLAPPMLTGLMFFACAAAFMFAVAGHLIILGRPDQRSLADLMAGSFVVNAPARPLPTDLDELADLTSSKRRNLIILVALEAVLVFGVVAVPALMTAKGGESTTERIARLRLEGLRAKFAAHPEDPSLARELNDELSRAGLLEESRTVSARHVQALSLKEVEREQALRETFEKNKDRRSAERLIELLEQQDRIDEAEEIYVAFLGETPEPSALIGFGNWLASNNRPERTVVVASAAVKADPLVAYGHTILGVALKRVGREEEAREHLELALFDEPDDDDARDALTDVERDIGALTPSAKTALRKQFDAWKKNAGN